MNDKTLTFSHDKDMTTDLYSRREWSALGDPKNLVENVCELLFYTDPESKERPLNYTQLQLEVQYAMAMDVDRNLKVIADYYANAFYAIQQHMQKRFKLANVANQCLAERNAAQESMRDATF